jgi:hypothetical protein
MAAGASPSIKQQVDRQFRQLHARRGDWCNNPITGDSFVWGSGRTSEEKRSACRALVAREWHAEHSPDALPLPVHTWDIDIAKRSASNVAHLLGYFSQSLAYDDWRISGHPPFEIYAQGVLASPECPWFFAEDKTLVALFPPRPIYGLQLGLVYVSPSKSKLH